MGSVGQETWTQWETYESMSAATSDTLNDSSGMLGRAPSPVCYFITSNGGTYSVRLHCIMLSPFEASISPGTKISAVEAV